MLESMRRGSQHIIVKMLLLMLALSFVVWGVGDIVRGSNKLTAAKVGDKEISYQQYSGAVQDEISQYQRAMGENFSVETLLESNVDQYVLNRMIHDALIEVQTGQHNIKVSPDSVRDRILSDASFINESGQFDQERFKLFLQQINVSEKRFFEYLAQRISTELYLSTFSSVIDPLGFQIQKAFDYEYQTRLVDLIVIPFDHITVQNDPSDADLVQFYNEHLGQFNIPQLRTMEYVTLDPDAISDDVTISDDEILQEYDDRRDEFSMPQSRDLEQYMFDDLVQAGQVFEQLSKGKTLKDHTPISMDSVTQDALPSEVVDAAFGLTEIGQVSAPVQSSLGYHLFVLKAIRPAHIKPFEEVRTTLYRELKHYIQSDLFFQYLNVIEDELAGGSTLDQVAAKFELTVKRFENFDAQGLTSSGEFIVDFEPKDRFLSLAFELEEGIESAVTDMGGDNLYVVARVNQILPMRVKALDEVKGKVIALWKIDEKKRQLNLYAKKMISDLKDNNVSMTELSKMHRFKYIKDQKLSRSTDGTYGAEFHKEIFALRLDQLSRAHASSDGSYVIAKLNMIESPEFDRKGTEYLTIRNRLMQETNTERMVQLTDYLKRTHEVVINERIVERVRESLF